jgi:hypothetical protein
VASEKSGLPLHNDRIKQIQRFAQKKFGEGIIVCHKKRNDADQLQVDLHALICGREDCRQQRFELILSGESPEDSFDNREGRRR